MATLHNVVAFVWIGDEFVADSSFFQHLTWLLCSSTWDVGNSIVNSWQLLLIVFMVQLTLRLGGWRGDTIIRCFFHGRIVISVSLSFVSISMAKYFGSTCKLLASWVVTANQCFFLYSGTWFSFSFQAWKHCSSDDLCWSLGLHLINALFHCWQASHWFLCSRPTISQQQPAMEQGLCRNLLRRVGVMSVEWLTSLSTFELWRERRLFPSFWFESFRLMLDIMDGFTARYSQCDSY